MKESFVSIPLKYRSGVIKCLTAATWERDGVRLVRITSPMEEFMLLDRRATMTFGKALIALAKELKR